MIIEGRNIKESKVLLKTKYCVIGSGAGGAVVAERLARDGHEVILIEEGGYFSPGSLRGDTEAIAMAKLYRDAVMQSTDDQSITLFQGQAIGGSTFVNHALCFHMPHELINEWISSGIIKDFTSDDLEKHYSEVERFLQPKVTPDKYMNSSTKLFHKTFQDRNLSTTFTKRNTNGCIGCGSCFRSCDIAAKSSTDLTFIPEAINNGAKVYSDFKAEKIIFKGKTATAVEGTIMSQMKQAKGTFRVDAEYIVVAAGALHSPWLLGRSGIKNKNLGKHLKIHPIVPMQALFKKDMDSFNGVPQAISSFQYTDYKNKKEKGFVYYCDFSGMMGTSTHMPGMGNELRERIGKLRKMGQTQIMLLENTTGEINCKKEKPVITYNLNEMDKNEFVKASKIMGNLYFESGAEAVYLGNQVFTSPDQLNGISTDLFEPFASHKYAAHFQSTCRMGASSKDSVTDNSGKVFDTENVYVADASILPDSVGVNPMLTIMAFASLVAERLSKK